MRRFTRGGHRRVTFRLMLLDILKGGYCWCKLHVLFLKKSNSVYTVVTAVSLYSESSSSIVITFF